VIKTLETSNTKLTRSVGTAGTSQRAQELQTLIDRHGSIDRAAARERIPRDLFRKECQALGVQARRRSELLPEVSELDREAREQRDELRRQTNEVIEVDLDDFFAPAREAFKEVWWRIFNLHDLQAASKFLIAYDKMNWWQRDLLVLSYAVAMGDADRKFSEAMLRGRLSSMTSAALYAVAADAPSDDGASDADGGKRPTRTRAKPSTTVSHKDVRDEESR
jgi:hypothetical protein